MAVVAFNQQALYNNDVETRKQTDGGIFSNFSPNNGNQTTLAGSVDPADARKQVAGLNFGGAALPASSTQSPSVQFGTSDNSGNDWRVRISINPNSKILYWDPDVGGNVPGLLSPLKHTDGFIFPYVPNVTVTHAANYSSMNLTHSNYAQYFYESSAVASISINGDFTVQSLDEAKYFLAAVYFFRACTKMFYGLSGDYQGSPPPIVYLDGYGQHYLPHVSCVITSFSHTMPNDVDYMEVNTPQSVTTTKTSNQVSGALGSIKLPSVSGTNAGNEITTQSINTAFNRVPTASTFNLTLQPIMSRTQAIDFSYKDFARGGLIAGKNNPYPGGYL
jgi:hypothetical protein